MQFGGSLQGSYTGLSSAVVRKKGDDGLWTYGLRSWGMGGVSRGHSGEEIVVGEERAVTSPNHGDDDDDDDNAMNIDGAPSPGSVASADHNDRPASALVRVASGLRWPELCCRQTCAVLTSTPHAQTLARTAMQEMRP